jgi:DNA-binding transcriptional LysR family regulator
VRLTQAGQVMLASCDNVLAHLDRTMRELDALNRLRSGNVVVGAGPYFGSYLLPPICATFQRLAPGVGIRLQTAKAFECVEALRRGNVELAVVGGQVDDPDFARSYLAGKDVVWIAPSDHKLASRSQITFSEIIAEHLVLPPRTSSSRRVLEKWANEHGFRLEPSVEVGGIEAQVTAVISGLGVAAVPSHVLSRYQDAPLRVLSVVGFPLHGSWTVVWRHDELSPAAAAFKDHLLQQRSAIEATSLYDA